MRAHLSRTCRTGDPACIAFAFPHSGQRLVKSRYWKYALFRRFLASLADSSVPAEWGWSGPLRGGAGYASVAVVAEAIIGGCTPVHLADSSDLLCPRILPALARSSPRGVRLRVTPG